MSGHQRQVAGRVAHGARSTLRGARAEFLCEFAVQVLARSRHGCRLPNVERHMGSSAGSRLGAPTGASSTLNAFAMSVIARTAPNPTSVNATNTRFHNGPSDT